MGVATDKILIALEKEIDRIDQGARDRGHSPHAWQRDGNTAYCFCSACGAGASVRIYPADLHVWSAGNLKLEDLDCPGK